MIKPKKSVEEMKEYKPPLEGRRGMLRLDFNENTLGPSPKVLEALKKIGDEDISAYPEYSTFKQKLANHARVKPPNLVITNAGDEAIKLLFETYVDKGQEIVLPVPTFTIFKFYAQLIGAKITEVLYGKNLSFPTKKVLQKITKKTKAVVLVNPNNPTGTPIKKDDIIKILKKAKNSLVIVDEAYLQFSEDTCVDLIDKYDNLAIIRTFSKAFGLAGLRLGYIISNEANVKNLLKASSPYGVNTMAMKLAEIAMEDKRYTDWYISQVKKGKKRVYDDLKKMRIKTYPSTANFILAYFGKRCCEVTEKLREKGILVRDRCHLPLLKGCVRITIGTEEQSKKVIDVLKEILEK